MQKNIFCHAQIIAIWKFDEEKLFGEIIYSIFKKQLLQDIAPNSPYVIPPYKLKVQVPHSAHPYTWV